jgi:hypothetical protein
MRPAVKGSEEREAAAAAGNARLMAGDGGVGQHDLGVFIAANVGELMEHVERPTFVGAGHDSDPSGG